MILLQLCRINLLHSFVHYIYHYHHRPPPHSASCPSESAAFVPSMWLKSTTNPGCRGWTTICASGLSALLAAGKSTTNASCTWWQPQFVQVECLHQLKEEKHHKCKVQKSEHKAQRSGPASALVAATKCNYNHHHQVNRTTHHDAAISTTCVRAHHSPYKPSPHKLHWLLHRTVLVLYICSTHVHTIPHIHIQTHMHTCILKRVIPRCRQTANIMKIR